MASAFLISGDFRFVVATRELSRLEPDGSAASLPLGSRAADILLLLLARPGELVAKQEIMEAAWPNTTVEESNLPVQIAALRRLLDAGREGGSAIATVPGRGYRFTLPVEPEETPTIDRKPAPGPARMEPSEGFAERPEDRKPADPGHQTIRRQSGWLIPTLAIGPCLVLLVGGGVWYFESRSPGPSLASDVPGISTPEPAKAELVPETIPFIPDIQRVEIRSAYLAAPDHKALAISLSRSGFSTGRADDETAKKAALDSCQLATDAIGTRYPCELYAVGNTVVFAGGNPPLPPAPWLIRNPAIERPFAIRDVPLINQAVRASLSPYYPNADKSKAMALSAAGFEASYIKATSEQEVMRRALELCGYRAGVACMIIAVDDSFVVPIPVTMKVTGFFHLESNASLSPEARGIVAQRFGAATNAWNGVAIGANGRPGIVLNAANEQDAIEDALTDCNRQDRDCRVIALGPFTVETAGRSK